MARKPRIHFAGALYHVIARGNQRQKTFRSSPDYTYYLELLGRYQQRYGFRLYAYVLMSNHVHLLMEVGSTPLSKIMQGLQQSYTLYFNRKYRLVGHLFQGRYKAFLCDRDSYLLELVRYLHLNPVRSRLVKDPALYPWSSHSAYLGKASGKHKAVQTEWVLSQFSRHRSEAVKRYRRFVLEGTAEGHREDLYAVKEQRYLGDEEFVEQVSRKVAEERPRPVRVELGEVEEAVYREYDLSVDLLKAKSKERRGAFGRALVAYLAQEFGGIKLGQVADRYGPLSLGLKRFRERIRVDTALRRGLESLMAGLRKGRRTK